MGWLFKTFWKTAAMAGALLGILYFAKDIDELPNAIKAWAPIMPTQEDLLIAFSIFLVLWIFWTDLRPLVGDSRILRTLRGLRVDPPDIILAKKQISDFVADHLHPCYQSIHEALRVASHVYKPKNVTGNIGPLVLMGIKSRFPERNNLHVLLDKNKIREFNLDGIQNYLIPAISQYLASALMLNIVCGQIIHDDDYIDKHNYTQKNNLNFLQLVQQWAADHTAFEIALNKLASGSDFSHLKHSVQTKKILTSNFNGNSIKQFLEHYEAPIVRKGAD